MLFYRKNKTNLRLGDVLSRLNDYPDDNSENLMKLKELFLAAKEKV